MSTNRNPVEVITEIIAHVPTRLVWLISVLKKLREDASWRAPEAQYPTWLDLKDILDTAIGAPPHPPWHGEIYRIVTGKEPPQADARNTIVKEIQ